MSNWSRSYPAVPYTTMNGGDLGADITGATVDLSDAQGASFEITYTNAHTAVGTFKLQVSNNSSSSNWATVLSIAVDSTLNASFDLVGTPATAFQYARVVYTRTSGGSTDTATANYRKILKV